MAGVKLVFPRTQVGELVCSDADVRYEGEFRSRALSFRVDVSAR